MIQLQAKLNCILQELEKFERRTVIKPLGKASVLWVLVEDFQNCFLGGHFPVQGMIRWQALQAACRVRSPSARNESREFYAWLRDTYLPLPRLHVCLESWTLILDGVAYSGIDPTLLRVIKVLDEARRAADALRDTVFVPEKTIKSLISEDLGEKAIRRMRRHPQVPTEVQRLIYAHSGKGLALILPPL
jgi:hypothetical protein